MFAARIVARRSPLTSASKSAVRSFTSTSPLLGEQFDVTIIGAFFCGCCLFLFFALIDIMLH